jgi:hypothetical protein
MFQNPMQIVIGAPATGSNFFPRTQISQKLQRALQVEHVLFLAPRRTGKTSVLLDLRQNAPERTVFLDLEGFNHPEAWINAMIDGLSQIQDEPWLQKLKQFGDFLPRLKNKYVEIEAADWNAKGQRLMDDLQQLDEPVWFLLDEFPIMIDHIAKTHGVALAESALHWIRRLRQQHPQSPVRFLLTGSIGLDSVLRRHGIRGAANDLRRELLTPLRPDEALSFALQLANDNQIALTEDLAQNFLQRLGPGLWPFFIQLFVAELQDTDSPPATIADIERVYQTIARGKRNQYAVNMWERLRDIFNTAEQAAARDILKKVAAQSAGIPLGQLRGQLPQFEASDFDYVLDVLQHDGYLTETDDGNICFFSHLLRDYWLYKGRV